MWYYIVLQLQRDYNYICKIYTAIKHILYNYTIIMFDAQLYYLYYKDLIIIIPINYTILFI